MCLIFLPEMQHFSTTQDFLRQILALHLEQPDLRSSGGRDLHLGCAAGALSRRPGGEAIAREMNWVASQLGQ